MWNLLGKGKESLYKWSRLHGQDGRHTHIIMVKAFKITKIPMTLKLGMKHQGLELYKVYINDNPWLTLTYFYQGQVW